jgi:hypothetical protein
MISKGVFMCAQKKIVEKKETCNVIMKTFPLDLDSQIKEATDKVTSAGAVIKACEGYLRLKNLYEQLSKDYEILESSHNDLLLALKSKKESEAKIDKFLDFSSNT